MIAVHPLLEASVVREVERQASTHRGRPWVALGFSDLNDRASHPCGVFHGYPFSVFTKLNVAVNAAHQFTVELRGLALLAQRAQVATPTPVAAGVTHVGNGAALLLFEALRERPATARSGEDWRSIGHVLATVHQVRDGNFGLERPDGCVDGCVDGFFGPLAQPNRPVRSNRWADFYVERRVIPHLRSAVDAGHLPLELAADVQRLLLRLPALSGPEPIPSLLHGDAQQNNFVSTPSGAVLVDPAPYFGHPEIDLALLDYFRPVPGVVFDAYREIAPIDDGFAQRRELWRLFGYLAVIAVDGVGPFGRRFVTRLAEAIQLYK